jgi:lipopolysaccharide biosynthesis glycosyltransferase
MSDVISISCASDEVYYCGLLVTLHSLCTSAAEGASLKIHVLDAGLSQKSRDDLVMRLKSIPARQVEVKFHVVDTRCFSKFPKWRGSYAAYARLALQDILVDEDWTVYTDVDTLWLRDVSELWSIRSSAPVLAAVPDGSGLMDLSSGVRTARLFAERGRKIEPEKYFCSGLILMNLKELRERNFFTECEKFLNENPALLDFPDQNLYNWIYPAPETLMLDWRWGEFAAAYGLREMDSSRVVHYAKAAPWKKSISAVNALWWRYVRDHFPKTKLGGVAKRKCLVFSFLRSSVGFFIVYGFAAIFNRKVFRKRLQAIRPSGLKVI